MWLDKVIECHDPGLSDAASNDLYNNLHDDPRWLPILDKIGMSPEALEAIQFELQLPDRQSGSEQGSVPI